MENQSVKNTTEIQLGKEIFYRYTLEGHTILFIKGKMGVSRGPFFCRPTGPGGRRDSENVVNYNT